MAINIIIVKSLCFSFIILASFAALFAVADARRFYVGGKGGWVINPKENYNTWAERNRFQVNDTLYFKYVKGSDSVQQVTKADYDGCNVKNPIKNFVNGESELTFDRSGPYYFISGNEDHCKKGQKLIVVVLAVRNHPVAPISPAKPPSSVSPSHAPTVSPASPSPSPKSTSPASSPSNPPSSSLSPEQSPPLSPSPPETTPTSGNATSPAASKKNSANGLAVTSVMSIVLSVVLTVMMIA